MENYVRRYFFLWMLIGCIKTLEASDFFPSDCKIIEHTNPTLTLSSKEPRLFLIRNQLESELWLAIRARSALPIETNSRLEKGKVLGFVTDVNPIEFYCVEVRPGHEQQVSCHESIMVCEWEKMTIPDKMRPPLWVVENFDMAALVPALSAQGFSSPQV